MCAPVAAWSAQRGHRVGHVPCLARITEHVRGSASTAEVTRALRVLHTDYGPTRVKRTSLVVPCLTPPPKPNIMGLWRPAQPQGPYWAGGAA